MSSNIASPATVDPSEAIEALADRVFTSGVAALELTTIYLGQQLGLYRTLADAGPLTVDGLAAAAQIDTRYAREWLQSQVLGGFVVADHPDLGSARFTLAPGGREVLVDEESPAYLAPLAQCLAATARVLPELVDAYRTGAGVPYAAYGADAMEAQAALNRPAYRHDLVSSWIPAMPSVAAKLAGGARVADIGCGAGWASIALATGFPGIEVDGFDADDASIAQARRNAIGAAVADRTSFQVSSLSDAAEPAYDVCFLFECLHDMSHPDVVLTNVRRSLRPDGEVIVMDERTTDTLEAPTEDPVQRFFGTASAVWCLPQGRTSAGAHPIGTVMRESDLRAVAGAAGFTTIEVLDVDHPVFRFYRLSG